MDKQILKNGGIWYRDKNEYDYKLSHERILETISSQNIKHRRLNMVGNHFEKTKKQAKLRIA